MLARQRLVQIGEHIVLDAAHDGMLVGNREGALRSEHVVVKRTDRVICNCRGCAGRLTLPVDETQTTFGDAVDGLALQPQHRTGLGLDRAVNAYRLLAAHRNPEELPAAALFQPVAVVVRNNHQHRVARLQPVMAALVEKPSLTADRMLQDGERRLAALATVPVVVGVVANLVAGAGRHGVQPMPSAGQGNGLHHRRAAGQFLEHRITHRSTIFLCSETHGPNILASKEVSGGVNITTVGSGEAGTCSPVSCACFRRGRRRCSGECE